MELLKADEFVRACPFCGGLTKTDISKKARYNPFIGLMSLLMREDGLNEQEKYKYIFTNSFSYICEDCEYFFIGPNYSLDFVYKEYRSARYNNIRTILEPNYLERFKEFSKRPDYINDIEKWIVETIGFDPTRQTCLDYGAFDGTNSLFKEHAYLYDEFLNRISLDKSFDLVTCCHVLEHLNEPREFVQKLFKYIKPDGHLYLEIPMHEQPLVRKLWHEHIGFFNEKSFNHVFVDQKLGNFKTIKFNKITTSHYGKPMNVLGVLLSK